LLITFLVHHAFAIKMGAAAFLLAGVVVAVYGTYLMTQEFHPFRIGSLVISVVTALFLIVTFQWKSANHLVADISLTEVNPQDRSKALKGVYFLFLSFILQTIGAVLAVMDVLVSTHIPENH
jgi:hypothetical protein